MSTLALVISWLQKRSLAVGFLLVLLILLLALVAGLSITCRILGGERDAALAGKAALAARLQLQNQAVETWRKAADAQKAKADEAATRAAQVRTRTVVRVERIAAEPVPSDCEGAVRWGAEAGKASGAEWEEER